MTENTNTNKFTSRKFIVWIVATLIMVACCVMGFITKETNIVTSFTGIWGGISMFYIGGMLFKILQRKMNEKIKKVFASIGVFFHWCFYCLSLAC